MPKPFTWYQRLAESVVANGTLPECAGCGVYTTSWYLPWASYQIRKIVDCACAGNAGNVFPCLRHQRRPLVNDPGMRHGTCVTHVPWCMSGSLTSGGGENVTGISGACAPAILRIGHEAHCQVCHVNRGVLQCKISLQTVLKSNLAKFLCSFISISLPCKQGAVAK